MQPIQAAASCGIAAVKYQPLDPKKECLNLGADNFNALSGKKIPDNQLGACAGAIADFNQRLKDVNAKRLALCLEESDVAAANSNCATKAALANACIAELQTKVGQMKTDVGLYNAELSKFATSAQQYKDANYEAAISQDKQLADAKKTIASTSFISPVPVANVDGSSATAVLGRHNYMDPLDANSLSSISESGAQALKSPILNQQLTMAARAKTLEQNLRDTMKANDATVANLNIQMTGLQSGTPDLTSYGDKSSSISDTLMNPTTLAVAGLAAAGLSGIMGGSNSNSAASVPSTSSAASTPSGSSSSLSGNTFSNPGSSGANVVANNNTGNSAGSPSSGSASTFGGNSVGAVSAGTNGAPAISQANDLGFPTNAFTGSLTPPMAMDPGVNYSNSTGSGNSAKTLTAGGDAQAASSAQLASSGTASGGGTGGAAGSSNSSTGNGAAAAGSDAKSWGALAGAAGAVDVAGNMGGLAGHGMGLDGPNSDREIAGLMEQMKSMVPSLDGVMPKADKFAFPDVPLPSAVEILEKSLEQGEKNILAANSKPLFSRVHDCHTRCVKKGCILFGLH